MVLFEDKSNCCGCTACMSICPKKAISMKPDEEGFLYPQINSALCVECGLCKTVCTFQNGYNKKQSAKIPEAYAAMHKDKEIRTESRSGGVFTPLSDYVLQNGGTIYGAGYGEHFKVEHKPAVTPEERDEFRGSKYVQSDLGNCFREIKEKLQNGEKVLFSGTACQTAALREYCGAELRRNLYLIDIVCHGVPSDLMWQEFLKLKEEEWHGEVEEVNFRNKKKYGWNEHRETLMINGKEYSSKLYAMLYLKDVMLRPSCYNCIYTNKRRPSDITLADFWGHEDAVPGFHNDDKGCSLILCNTKKGQAWLKKVWKPLSLIEVTGYKYRHLPMRKPVRRPEDRDEFWKDYNENGFKYVAEKYTTYKYVPYYKRWFKELLNKFGLKKVRNFLRKLYKN